MTLTVHAGSGSGTFDELWQMSAAPGQTSASLKTADEPHPVATIKAPPLINKQKDDRLASLDGSMAEWLLVQRQRSFAREQQIALTSLNAATGENQTVLAKLNERATLTPARGWYDVYGVYHPYGSAGYQVQDQLVSSGANYFRTVSYVPQVVYVTPYAYRGPCYDPCYTPCYGPKYKPRYNPCRYRYGSPLTVRATGDWGFVNYRSGGYCNGPSLKVRINID